MVSNLCFRVFFLGLKRHLLVFQMFHRTEVRMNEIPDIFNLTDAPEKWRNFYSELKKSPQPKN